MLKRLPGQVLNTRLLLPGIRGKPQPKHRGKPQPKHRGKPQPKRSQETLLFTARGPPVLSAASRRTAPVPTGVTQQARDVRLDGLQSVLHEDDRRADAPNAVIELSLSGAATA